MNLSGSTALVTGADGFAGHHVCRQLVERGAHVKAFVKPGPLKNLQRQAGLDIITGDLTDHQSVLNATKGVDAIFHFGALTLIPETRAVIGNTFSVNAAGTLNLLLAAKEMKVERILYASTCHVYGKQNTFPLTESVVPIPIDIYSASKLAGEHLCTAFVEMFGLDVTISRAFNHFGPGQREEFLIPSVIFKILRKQPLKLGNPYPTRDFTYVEDIARGYIDIVEKGKRGEVYQLCSGKERTVEAIVDTILRTMGSKEIVQWDPGARKVDLARSLGTYEKAKRDLGWEPRVPFEEGMQKTVDWYRNPRNW